MKICLIAINSKYIHENLAVHSLRAFAKSKNVASDILEFTINQTPQSILQSIYQADADVYAFSVYIWNVTFVYHIIDDLTKVKPAAQIWLGGPEVSYNAEAILRQYPNITGIMRGEGEATFAALGQLWKMDQLDQVYPVQITYRDGSGEIISTEDGAPMNMDELVFPYDGRELDPTRIYYYETSRGCPFRCAYCLSSLDKNIRFRSLALVKKELDYFLAQKVPQVKFVDRTFNCDRKRAYEIWQYIKDHDNGITNFHFEISADLLTDDDLALLATLRPGQIQMEIGVQTTNPRTMEAINRTASWDKLAANVRQLLIPHNIHIHLDLIAGLPYEDMASFRKSFNDVYGLKPLQLQLGFLKVLRGTPLETMADATEYEYSSNPPYEVLATPWMSYAELMTLKGITEMVETYYNSRQFEKTIEKLEEYFPDHFELYYQLSRFYTEKKYHEVKHARIRLYEILLEFITANNLDRHTLIPLLLSDAYAREKLKHFPQWGKGYEGKQDFDYEDRDPLTNNARPMA